MSPAESRPVAPSRLTSIDAYRGFVMLLMMGEALSFGKVAAGYPGNPFWALLDFHQSHVAWVGCSLHDLIQPSFSFLVGVALPFSIASRKVRGQSAWSMRGHALMRALILIFLGVFLRSTGRPQTNFTFEDTLSQIGLGYVFLFLLGERKVDVQWAAFWVVVVGYWVAFAAYPLPGPDFDWGKVGVAADWSHHAKGFAAHWNKNSNLAWAFDTWFLNLFPREKPFVYNGGGYSTLSFIPTLGTMILGLIAGGWLKNVNLTPKDRIQRFVMAGVIGLLAGWLLNALGICPNVKKIWTPSWVLFSGGWCFLFLAGFYWVIDVKHRKGWSFPLVVIGMNSIAAYCMDHLFGGFIRAALKRHLPEGIFTFLGPAFVPTLHGGLMLVVLWLILYWMNRNRIFLRI